MIDNIDNLFSIPHTEEKYNISAGEIEKGNVTVQVFEISTNYGTVFNGLDAKNKNVIVIGGGDTAMDCVRSAVRQGAKTVKCLYRRDQKNMPGSQREVHNAIEEGVDFNWLTLPIEYIGHNQIEKIKIVKMQLGSPDESGRRSPQSIPNSQENLEIDLIIEALGFEPENLPKLFNTSRVDLDRKIGSCPPRIN